MTKEYLGLQALCRSIINLMLTGDLPSFEMSYCLVTNDNFKIVKGMEKKMLKNKRISEGIKDSDTLPDFFPKTFTDEHWESITLPVLVIMVDNSPDEHFQWLKEAIRHRKKLLQERIQEAKKVYHDIERKELSKQTTRDSLVKEYNRRKGTIMEKALTSKEDPIKEMMEVAEKSAEVSINTNDLGEL